MQRWVASMRPTNEGRGPRRINPSPPRLQQQSERWDRSALQGRRTGGDPPAAASVAPLLDSKGEWDPAGTDTAAWTLRPNWGLSLVKWCPNYPSCKLQRNVGLKLGYLDLSFVAPHPLCSCLLSPEMRCQRVMGRRRWEGGLRVWMGWAMPPWVHQGMEERRDRASRWRAPPQMSAMRIAPPMTIPE